MSETTNITLLLDQAATGDRVAANELFQVVYQELKRLAQSQMKSEGPITLQATAIVHEVWIKLVGNRDQPAWNNRNHFFAAAAQAMRRILVDSAKARKRLKRGGGQAVFELRDDDHFSVRDDDLLALNDALEQLADIHPRKAELVTLRYFGGMTYEQAAEQLKISVATAERDWAFAKAWLRSRME